MTKFQVQDIVGDVVAQRPSLSRVFEKAGIDYCCGGRKTLEEVCRKKGLEPASLIEALQKNANAKENGAQVDVLAMSLTDLADHIVQTHHEFLRSELTRLDRMTKKVAMAHGKANIKLHEIRETFLAMSSELVDHMMKEEKILFPMIRQLDENAETSVFHCGTLANPIRQMETEHTQAGSALERLRELTDDYTPPEWACNTYRAMLDGLENIEQDLHVHIHKENNVLFPRAIKMESLQCA